MRYLRHLGLEEHDANDVISDVFIRLLRSLSSFDLYSKPGRFRTYLWKLTYCALVDNARRLRARQRAEKEWVIRFHRADETESWKLQKDLEEINHQRIMEQALQRIQVATPSKAWKCFEQRVIYDRPAAVIATTGITSNTVFVNTSRVLKRVQDQCCALARELGDDHVERLPGRA